MYQKEKSGWIKHWDFILLDILCVGFAYLLAYFVRHGHMQYMPGEYRQLAILTIVFNVVVAFFAESYRGILRRGKIQEFKSVVYQTTLLFCSILAFLFIIKDSAGYSRSMLIYFWILSTVFIYVVRILRKQIMIENLRRNTDLSQLMIVTTKKDAKDSVEAFTKEKYCDYTICGLVILDHDMKGEMISEVPVVANRSDLKEYVVANVIDEVFFNLPYGLNEEEELAELFIETGVTVHINLNRVRMDLPNKVVEKMNKYTVVTSSVRIATTRQMLIKRCVDIVGSIVGLMITAVAFIFVAPVIFIQSPGPVFFSQERVGRGGRKFRIYKFRSMYMDAEERKKELMAQNKMDGLMFKMDDDPRIFPAGKFIRKYSIDELPQFWNVLMGDMSLVGTRPPTVDEYEQYELHHKVRLSIKPGITGLWQVSGRSDITDFEEVVRLDSQYISEWSLAEDIKILFRTVLVVLGKDGAV